uniref:Uncharacterized protein n=1 Tax=Siphoviridae sp. ctGO42 TaxID=2827566 RepID=A0A8S5LIG0_9CAUD|nr:MAG TPA: hypothetical protein [Siphoviridae sp. ctGO42]
MIAGWPPCPELVRSIAPCEDGQHSEGFELYPMRTNTRRAPATCISTHLERRIGSHVNNKPRRSTATPCVT